jgi:flagella basal body P-ring formation protein FlgA
MKTFLPTLRPLWRAMLLGGLAWQCACASEPAWQLQPSVSVNGAGVFLDQLFVCEVPAGVPHVRLAGSPFAGQTLSFSRKQIAELARQAGTTLPTNITGALAVKISRQARRLESAELNQLLTDTLQRLHVKERGQLELRFTRTWNPLLVPEEPISLHVLELPNSGVTPSFVTKFELRTEREVIGTYQMAVQAKVWREVLVTRSPIPRGTPLSQADVGLDKRDVLVLRDGLVTGSVADAEVEFAESLQAGAPVYMRSLKLRPVVRRGRVVDVVVQSSGITIASKGEVLEDGAPGQTVRVRNLKSRREVKARVRDEETVLVNL